MTVCEYDCKDCVTKCADRNIDKELDISEHIEYLEIGSHPDIEELGLADCLPEDY